MPKVKVTAEGHRFDHNYSESAEVNLIKFHRKVHQSKKVCRAYNLGSHIQGHGHNRKP